MLFLLKSIAMLFPAGWLEPLLDEIHKNYSIVVTPVIDVIDDQTLQYHYGSAKSTSIGGFDWNLQFNWHAIPAREHKRRSNPVRLQLLRHRHLHIYQLVRNGFGLFSH